MKGRSLEELDEIFEAGMPARRFPEYKCKIVEEVKQDVLTHGTVTVAASKQGV